MVILTVLNSVVKEDVFREIYEKNKERVFKTALIITGSLHSSEDITQDVFIRVYKNIGNINNIESVSAWINKIAVNCSIDFINKNKKYIVDTEVIENLHEVDLSAMPGNNIIKEELYKKLLITLYNLPVHYRIPIILFYYKNLSMKEIASLTHCLTGTIKSRLFNGKKLLKEKMEEYLKE